MEEMREVKSTGSANVLATAVLLFAVRSFRARWTFVIRASLSSAARTRSFFLSSLRESASVVKVDFICRIWAKRSWAL